MRLCVCSWLGLVSVAVLGCEAGPANCAALGDEVLPDLPLYSPVPAVDCGTGGWTDTVTRLDDTHTRELERSASAEAPVLLTRGDGLIAVFDDMLLGLDGEGEELWRASYTSNASPDHPFVAIAGGGKLYLSDRFGGDAKIVIFDGDSGQQLDFFIVEFAVGGPRPTIAARGEELWLSHMLSDESGAEERVAFGRYADGPEPLEMVTLDGGWEMRPLAMRWAPDGTLVAAGNYSVYRADPGEASVLWTVEDGQVEGIWARELVVSGDLVVVSNPILDEDYDLGWRVAGYELDSGALAWSVVLDHAVDQSFDLAALGDDGHVIFVGQEASGEGSIDGQPMLVVLDRAGQLVAGERLAVPGAATSVELGAGGRVFVAGDTPIGESWALDFTRSAWLRYYDSPLW